MLLEKPIVVDPAVRQGVMHRETDPLRLTLVSPRTMDEVAVEKDDLARFQWNRSDGQHAG